MKIIQNGYKLTSDFKTFPTQFSENVEVQFIRDKKFSEAFIQPFIAYGKGRIHVLAPTILEDDTIVFPKEVFTDSGEIVLSVSIEANNKIENTEVLAIRVLKSAGLENVLPENKDTWQTVLKNYLMQELKLNINPRIETIVKETERLQDNTTLLQEEIAKLIKESNDKVNKLVTDVTKMVDDGDFDGSTIMNGEGVPSDSIGKDNDLYINKLSDGDLAQFLFIKTNGVWIPRFKVAGRDGTDSLPVKGSMFLPEELNTPPGYAISSEHYVPAEYIGIDGNTSLPDALNATSQRIKYIEDNSITTEPSIASGSDKNVPTIKAVLDGLRPKQLIINPDFLCNQRGLSSYTLSENNSMYTLDMWFIYAAQNSSIKVTKKSNSILIETTGSETQIQQMFDILNGKHTISTKIISINGNVKLSKYNNGFTDVKTDLRVGVNNVSFDSTFNRIAFRFSGTCSLELEYVDLFEGDIAYQHIKEDPSIALLRCQRYLLVLRNYISPCNVYGNNLYATIPLPTMMATNPTVTISNLAAIIDGFDYKRISYMDFAELGICTLFVKLVTANPFTETQNGKAARIYSDTGNGLMIISCEPL